MKTSCIDLPVEVRLSDIPPGTWGCVCVCVISKCLFDTERDEMFALVVGTVFDNIKP
jgi:hypothetical protein